MITEELLAAFEEGKTNAEETALVLEYLATDESLQEEFILSQQLDAMMGADDEETDFLPMAQMAAKSEGNLCDFQCEQFILKRRKIEYNSDELSEEARNNSWLRERGTPLHSVGRLLEQRGLIVMRSYGSSIDSVIRALKAGHDAIVVVNSCRLPENSEEEIAYHAAVVLDVNEEEVTLYDPATGEESTAYPKDHFIAAWNDAKAYLARVKVPDLDYNPRPIDLEDVELSTDLIELREDIAENAHEVWADQRQEEGWTYGPQRDDEKKETPDMVPYSMLPYSEKEYDRRMAFDTIKLMKKLGVQYCDCHSTGTIIHMAVDGQYAGHIVISDVVKPHSKEAIEQLKRAGVQKTVMLTGDAKRVADSVAAELGVDEVRSELLPGDKVAEVEKLLAAKGKNDMLAFVGDGINDAPVLTRADIGIAMGAMGSDAAIEAADIVLMDDDPLQIAKAIKISRKCIGIVRQNIVFSLVVKFGCLALVAFGVANMWAAIFADVGVMVLAVLNAIRALKYKG